MGAPTERGWARHLLVQHQPALVQIVAADGAAAVNAAAFIQTLRAGLIEMHKGTPAA